MTVTIRKEGKQEVQRRPNSAQIGPLSLVNKRELTTGIFYVLREIERTSGTTNRHVKNEQMQPLELCLC